MKRMRSSVWNSVLSLRTDALTTDDDQLVEELGRAADDVEVAVRDRVVGPGQTAIAGCGSGAWMRMRVSP